MADIAGSDQNKWKVNISMGRNDMGEWIRSFNWSETSLGPIESWPQSLKTSVDILLGAPNPMFIGWGKEMLLFYNDACLPLLGKRHPEALGKSGIIAEADVWNLIGSLMQDVLVKGKTSYSEKQLLILNRNGYPEETYFSFSFSPIPDEQAGVAGVFCVCSEQTDQVLNQRRLSTLRNLSKLSSLENIEDVFKNVSGVLAENPCDFPFGLFYKVTKDGKSAEIKSAFGIPDHSPAAPPVIDLNTTKEQIWPLAQVCAGSKNSIVVHNIQQRIALFSAGPWEESSDNALIIAVKKFGNGELLGFFIAGISSRLKFDEAYQDFLNLVAGQIKVSIGGIIVDDKPNSFAIANDITERKQGEIDLNNPQERFSSIFNQTSVGIAQSDLKGRFLLVNDRYCEMVGRSKEELYQIRMQDISHEVELPENLLLFNRAIKEGIPFKIEKRYIRPDGSEIWVSNDVSLVKDQNGNPWYIQALCKDITERKRVEFEQKRFRALCENSSDFIGIASPDGQAFYVNPAGRKMVGLDSMEEVLQTKLINCFTEEDQVFVNEVILPEQWETGQWKGEFRFRNFKTGQIIPVYYHQFLIKDPDTGAVLGIATVSPDITERKRTEAALKESEQRFRAMAEASGIMIAQTNSSGDATYFNKEWLNLTGRSIDELLDSGWADLIHPDDRQGFIDASRAAYEKREVLKQEFRVLSKEGVYRWQLAVVSPHFRPNGSFAGFISSCVDISEQKQIEEALTVSEDRFRTFANNIQNLAWMADPTGWVFWYNQQWYDFTGTTFEEMQGWGWEKVHHPDYIQEVTSFAKQAWGKGETWELIFPLKGANGEYRWFLTRAFAVKDANNKVVRWIGTNTDITEQKTAEEELKKFKIISDYAFDAFILMREDGTFAYLNDLALKRWGYTPQEATGIRVPDVDPIYQEEKFKEVFALAQQKGALPTFETIHKRKDGTLFPVEVSMGSITLDEKPFLFAVARDITERKQTEAKLKNRNEELQRTNNDLDNFIYTASHDLKAPILNIEGLMDMLVDDLPATVLKDPGINKVMALISDAVSRFKSTINDLTEITKLQRLGEEQDVAIVHLPIVFEEIRLDLQKAIQEAGAEFEVDFSQCATLQFSRKNLRSILYNLVSNAIKYRSPNRQPLIRVFSEKEREFCVLTVQDNGLGVDLAEESKMFSMFKRLHDHVEGTGIGLYIVKKIVENSGGTIKVKSEVGKGSAFKIYLINKPASS